MGALPIIPQKAFFNIGEAANLCDVKPHVLRYWEQEFSQLAPIKRRGNRRFYSHDDVLIARRIRELLYLRGFTISGARAELAKSKQRIKSGSQKKSSIICKLEDLLEMLS